MRKVVKGKGKLYLRTHPEEKLSTAWMGAPGQRERRRRVLLINYFNEEAKKQGKVEKEVFQGPAQHLV